MYRGACWFGRRSIGSKHRHWTNVLELDSILYLHVTGAWSSDARAHDDAFDTPPLDRARIRQLEAEAANHTSRLAALECRAASELRAEQESCLAKISDAETRHQVMVGGIYNDPLFVTVHRAEQLEVK